MRVSFAPEVRCVSLQFMDRWFGLDYGVGFFYFINKHGRIAAWPQRNHNP